ncbi:MAG TPA: hypothetical protein VJ464_20035 [Blastocatellia bacterium]|nr:hypothetical protein [Blastocatellia bacterium]
MNEAATKLQHFERAVMWRRRWLALQDHLALALLASGLIAAALVVLSRLQIARLHWSVEILAAVAVTGLLAWRWHQKRATGKEAAFLIDKAFALEDRVTTAHEILARGEVRRDVEQALMDDAASRLDDKRAAAVVPYRLRAWHVVALAGIAAFVVAVAMPTRQLPGGEAIVEAQTDIQSAGEQMEEVGEAIAKLAPAESETAKLAKEQAALGRSFRMSPESRAEALRQLSALEERIRKRHSELAATHADEIVSVAEKRMRNAIEPARKEKSGQDEVNDAAQAGDDSNVRDENQNAGANDTDKQKSAAKRRATNAKEPPKPSSAMAQTNDAARKVRGKPTPPNANPAEPQTTAANQPPPSASNPSDNQQSQGKNNPGQPQESPQKPPQKPVSGQPPANATAEANKQSANPPQGGNPQSGNPPSAPEATAKADGQPNGQPSPQGEQPKPEAKPEANQESNNPLANLAAEQAGKMLPQLSQELLKKAAELRDGKLSPDDIKRLQQSAEFLARDLSKIAQSKEMQQLAEQLAKQITPEQIEQFARALGNQEELKRELQASARLMMENQQAKSTVAGMAQSFAKWGEQFDRRDRNGSGNRQPNDGKPEQSQGNNRGGRGVMDAKDEQAGRDIMRAAGGLTAKADGPRQPTGQGRDARLSGNPQRGTGGEFLYLKSPAGPGASRAPYTSAYPQYRREAERAVERSQVPPRLRSVVKSYFDAINPDAAKKQ